MRGGSTQDPHSEYSIDTAATEGEADQRTAGRHHAGPRGQGVAMRRKLVLLVVGALALGSVLVASPPSSAAPPPPGPTVFVGRLDPRAARAAVRHRAGPRQCRLPRAAAATRSPSRSSSPAASGQADRPRAAADGEAGRRHHRLPADEPAGRQRVRGLPLLQRAGWHPRRVPSAGARLPAPDQAGDHRHDRPRPGHRRDEGDPGRRSRPTGGGPPCSTPPPSTPGSGSPPR